jgi:hypothetical protein
LKRLSLVVLVLIIALGVVPTANAGPIGYVSTDRFGYTGTAVRYSTLADAQSGQGALSTTAIGARDLALFIVNGVPTYAANTAVVMGSWWYTTDPDHGAYSGWGNTTGNSGVGFVQLYDEEMNSVDSLNVAFGGFDGTFWTTYALSMTGSGATYPGEYARLWLNDPWSGGSDHVVFHNYALNLTASGLQGTQSGGMIVSSNHPTGVSGSFTAIVENVGPVADYNGFYALTMNLDMTNWAYENRDNLNGSFSRSDFGAPVPDAGSSLLLLGMSLAGLRAWKRSLK